jgi:hypothetical protein
MMEILSSLLRDARYGLRGLRKTPAFTLGAIVTVALTVGATTAIFSVVYGVLLRQLPYDDVERVFWIWSDQPGRDRTPFNVPDFVDYRDTTRTLASFAGYFAYSAFARPETSSTSSALVPASAGCCNPPTSSRARITSSCSPSRSGCAASALIAASSAARFG